nr:hypothetical protein [Tanacetum cinerariifolium]
MLGSIDCANNDINVLDNSSLFDDILNDTAPVVPYVANGVGYEKGYYLADGIYPQWATFVKSSRLQMTRNMLTLKSVKKVHGKMSNKMAVFDWNEVYANPARSMQRTWIERCETQRRKNKEMRDRDTHLLKLSPFHSSTWNTIIREINVLKSEGVDLISRCKIRVGNVADKLQGSVALSLRCTVRGGVEAHHLNLL